MFSVIIPLYNKSKYVEKALQSVINQTFRDFEIIVVDDGSTDNGLEIIQRFTIHNSQFTILTQQNSGVSTARNNGVKAAKYDYIAFLDADDWWAENYLEEMAALINDFPEGKLFASSYFKVKNGKDIPAQIGVSKDFTRGYFDYFEAYSKSLWMPVWTGATVVEKNTFDEIGGFKPNLKLGEDFDLWVRIALKYKTVLINNSLAYYNQDVDLQTRGVRMQKPENHFLFALSELYAREKTNEKLHQVLDNLRVYGLFPYFLNKNTRNQALAELKRVDWTKQPKKEFQRYYKTPIGYLKTKMKIIEILYNNIVKFNKKYYFCHQN